VNANLSAYAAGAMPTSTSNATYPPTNK
jgi:hypothetical protein